ncbi:MAG: hypothetical protein COA79_21140 [Planctomycetota bacterium]|nr:MAG: hypothetical protein COA79_21140 [Planctomycetota bacterium]
MDLTLELLKLGAVGILSGAFSSYLVARINQNKKWWELRVQSYQEVINALSDMKYYYDKQYDAEITQINLTKEMEAKLSEVWNDSHHKVRKASDSGVFLFSENVNKALKEFTDLENKNFNTFFEYLESSYSIASKCLEAVVESANIDLRINNSWL